MSGGVDSVIEIIKKRNMEVISNLKNEMMQAFHIAYIILLLEKEVAEVNFDPEKIIFARCLYSSNVNSLGLEMFSHWMKSLVKAINNADEKLVCTQFTIISKEICQSIVDAWNNDHPTLKAKLECTIENNHKGNADKWKYIMKI